MLDGRGSPSCLSGQNLRKTSFLCHSMTTTWGLSFQDLKIFFGWELNSLNFQFSRNNSKMHKLIFNTVLVSSTVLLKLPLLHIYILVSAFQFGKCSFVFLLPCDVKKIIFNGQCTTYHTSTIRTFLWVIFSFLEKDSDEWFPSVRVISHSLVCIDGHNRRWIDGSIPIVSIDTIDQYFWSHFHRC
jgi:hypothetical protein